MAEHAPTVASVVRTALAKSSAQLEAHEQGVFEGADPHAVHQARVATRRLRSDLRTFEPFLDERWATSLRGELRWLTSELGAVRDIEVMRDRLRGHAEQLAPSEADMVGPVLRRLDADREGARTALLASMRSGRYTQLRAALSEGAQRPRLSGRAAKRPERELGRVVRGRWKKLKRAVDELGTTPSDEALHGVRIRAKRCRYAAEACVPVFGEPASRFAREMARVQDVLGEHHDGVVAGAWLAKTAQECSPGQAFALGRLAEIEHAAANRSRADFGRVWRRARRKRLRAWM
jgi:CHAD domain-containing protein